MRRGAWFANAQGLVALGVTHQTVRIDGHQVRTAPGGVTTTVPAGLFALSSNSGRFAGRRL